MGKIRFGVVGSGWRAVPVLSETPPAPEVADMIDLWEYLEQKGEKVCVAKQYFLQPCYAAVRAGAQ